MRKRRDRITYRERFKHISTIWQRRIRVTQQGRSYQHHSHQKKKRRIPFQGTATLFEFITHESVLVTIMLRLERTIWGNADVRRLLWVKLGELHADTIKMQARDFLVEVLGQDVNFVLIFITA